jgi:hypothetical protein
VDISKREAEELIVIEPSAEKSAATVGEQ